MKKNLFDIENFNIIEDEENYYFFRALNMGDNFDIENNITVKDNKIERIRTDRERYEGIPMYKSDDSLTLEEIFDHIKMHHRKDTNCISLTSNANVAAIYGRGYYKDRYVLVKVPKNKLGQTIVNAPQYMMDEIQKRINKYLEKETNPIIKYYIDKIDNAYNEEQLKKIIAEINEKAYEEDDSFQRGINFTYSNTTPVDYQALTKEQNLEKNKMIAKLNFIKENIIPNVSNKFLVQTLGNAFSSLELTHYNDIRQDEFREIPKEIVDIFALLQQAPKDYPNIKELKKLVLNYNGPVTRFAQENSKLDIESDYTIENMYNLTKGRIDFYTAINLYRKSYYLAKSKLRARSRIELLKQITQNNPKYQNIINHLEKHSYGVEPEIFSRLNGNKYQVSESVNLDINTNEQEYLNFINNLNPNQLQTIIENPLESLKYYLSNISTLPQNNIDKDTYYASAIIDTFNWSKLDIESIDERVKNDIIDKLKTHNCAQVYEKLKQNGVKEKYIGNLLLTTLIKDKEPNYDLEDTFTIDQLETFLGYYQIKGTKSLKLRDYQSATLTNIDKAFQTHNFTSAVLPTGAGKSFVALAEMLKYRDKEILYLAPNDVILNQIENYIVEYIYGKTVSKTTKQIVKEVFPNLKLKTYSSLLSINQDEIIDKKYDLIVFDEIHRTGAEEWNRKILKLIDNQGENIKVLGISATPQRDVDNQNMADYWAEYLGYKKEEILRHKHLAINMDLEEAIRMGYVVNPKLVSCQYSLLNKNGLIDTLGEEINQIEDEKEKQRQLTKFDSLRRRLSDADGIDKVISDSVKMGGKYIVFCPIINKNGRELETEDGEQEDSLLQSTDIIEFYQNKLKEYLLKNKGIDESQIECTSMLGQYSKAKNQSQLNKFERNDPNKIKFMVVMNKLNEGAHVNNIDGIIWLRPLDENSKILYLQQLGRCIFGIDPNKKFPDEKRPIVIDIPNNTIMVNMTKNNDCSSDLDRLIIIQNWIEEHNGRIPNISSTDKVERNHGQTLRRIKNKYIIYLTDKNKLERLPQQKQEEIKQIIEISNLIDLWHIDFPKSTNVEQKQDKNENIFKIIGLLKDYIDLKKEVDSISKKQKKTFEEYLEEICDLPSIPKDKDSRRFKDGSAQIASWIAKHKEDIIKLAQEGNENAITICKDKGWMELSDEEEIAILEETLNPYLEEICDLPSIPKADDSKRFKDDSARIGGWITKHKEDIIKLAQAGNEYAITICKAKGWMELSDEEEIAILEETLNPYLEEICNLPSIPKSKDPQRFKDGSAKIGGWIQDTHREDIIKLAQAGNEYAITICKAKGWMELSLEEEIRKLELELNSYLEEICDLPSIPTPTDPKRFKDGSSRIGGWITKHKNGIIKLAQAGNENAITICKAKGWMELSLEEEIAILEETLNPYLEEICDLPSIPKDKDPRRFKDGSAQIIQWIFTHKKDIIKLAQAGNEYAITICKAKGWIELSLEEKINKLEETLNPYLEEICNLPSIPKDKDPRRFKDGSAQIGTWVHVTHKDDIIKLAQVGNEYAITICKAKGWIELSLEEEIRKLELELNPYLEEICDLPSVPKADDSKRFKDGSSRIGGWITKHKEDIIKLAQAGNEYAIKICKAKGWMELSFEDEIAILEETLNPYLEEICNLPSIPTQKDPKRFDDDSAQIGRWITRNKKGIVKLAQVGNEYAITICKDKGWMDFLKVKNDFEKESDFKEIKGKIDSSTPNKKGRKGNDNGRKIS